MTFYTMLKNDRRQRYTQLNRPDNQSIMKAAFLNPPQKGCLLILDYNETYRFIQMCRMDLYLDTYAGKNIYGIKFLEKNLFSLFCCLHRIEKKERDINDIRWKWRRR